MKKIILIMVMIVFSLALFTGCSSSKSDALKFKEEYESLNDKTNASGVKYRSVNIDKDNPFIYSSASHIVKMVEEGKSFYVYFGDSMCPWCRSVIEKLIQNAKEFEISNIYYVKIWDDNHNEILRDRYEINSEQSVVKVKDGDENYYKLLSYFDNVLDTYTLTNSDGNKIGLQEKRIYAPNLIYVKNGKAEVLTEGISSLQKGARDELTDEILADEDKLFKEFFEATLTCDSKEAC